MLSAANTKLNNFIKVAKILNKKGIEPVLYGSLGLYQIIEPLSEPEDIDILVPELWLSYRWKDFFDFLTTQGFVQDSFNKYKFTHPKIKGAISLDSLEETKRFSGLLFFALKNVNTSDVRYKHFSAQDHLYFYKAVSQKPTRSPQEVKADLKKIAALEKYLNSRCPVCEKKIGSGGCSFTYLISDEEVIKKRLWAKKHCKECGAKKGEFHHLECLEEQCPICKNNLNSNNCEHMWTDCINSGPKYKKIQKFINHETFPKLILFTLLTFGLYPFWWMYKTWLFFIKKEELNLNPLLLTLFWPIYIFVLTAKIKKTSAEEHYIFGNTSYLLPVLINVFYFSWLNDPSFVWLMPFSFILFINLEAAMRQIYRRKFPHLYL